MFVLLTKSRNQEDPCFKDVQWCMEKMGFGFGELRKQAWSLNNGGLWKKAERKNEESKENFYSSLLNNST